MQKSKYENAAVINRDTKLTSTVEDQNKAASAQCRRRITQCETNEPPTKPNGTRRRRRRSSNGAARKSKRKKLVQMK